MKKWISAAAALMVSLGLTQAAHAGFVVPSGNFNTFTFNQQSFNFDGTNTTVVGHVHLELSVFNVDTFFGDPVRLDVTGLAPAGMTATPGTPFGTTLTLALPPTPPSAPCSGTLLSFSCTLNGDITFVGLGNLFNGALFTVQATMFSDNATDPGQPIQLAFGERQFNGFEPSNVPAPASLALLGAGLAGLGLAKRRAKR